jgi:hypothetical protein
MIYDVMGGLCNCTMVLDKVRRCNAHADAHDDLLVMKKTKT